MTSSSLAFFSERRIQSLSQQLGNDRLNQLVETIESIIRSRLLAQGPSSSPISFKQPSDIEQVSLDKIRLYTDCELIHSCLPLSSHCWQTLLGTYVAYFNQLHPTYPFLDRHVFEDKVFGPNLSEELCANSAFSALYHTVLALGCQYHEGGAFDPGNGKAWKLFQVSLGLVSDILMPRGTLMGLQVCYLRWLLRQLADNKEIGSNCHGTWRRFRTRSERWFEESWLIQWVVLFSQYSLWRPVVFKSTRSWSWKPPEWPKVSVTTEH